jgi:two-component system sensor histidine kinase KdpD
MIGGLSRLSFFLLLPVSLAIATSLAFVSRDAGFPVSAALLFVMTVLINGSVAGLVQGLTAAIYVSLCYTLFIRYPVYRDGLNAIEDLFPIVALAVTAILSGAVSGKLRDHMVEADTARLQLRRLFDYSNELQRAITLDQIVRALTGAVTDRRTLGRILDLVSAELTLADRGKWDAAVRLGLATPDRKRRKSVDWPEEIDAADERAIANLTAMAIERCELLEEHSAAQTVLNSERMKTALLSSLSHDLRTPISAIAATAGTLKGYGGMIDEASRSEMLDTIVEQCAHLDAFTGKLLSLGRLEAGFTADKFELVDVEEVLGSVLAIIRRTHPDRRITRRIAQGAWLIMASPVLLEQVLFNVVENALRYSASDTDVVVTLDAADEMIAISVTDQGCGIAGADLPHIFERFYRGSNGAGQSGHGLGLAITKAFLDMIGGEVRVASPTALGPGTQVVILLPQAEMGPTGAADA